MKALVLLFILIASLSCNQTKTERPKMTEEQLNDQLAKANKFRVQKESAVVNEFILRHQFKTEQTGTGLRYQIYVKTENGESPMPHDTVCILCKVFLLDGTMCYETDSLNPIIFRLEEGQEARGLEEGIMKMKAGESARLIIPNHLAYGLSGDGDKIPPAAALFIDVRLLKIGK